MDPDRVLSRCARLAQISEEPGRLTRRSCTPQLAEANALVGEWMTQAGLDVRVDAAGNLIGRRAGSDPSTGTLLLGSHLDSVRDAGAFDGPLGVLVALEAAAAAPPSAHALDVIAFTDEEGLRFGTAYIGSRAIAGTFDDATLAARDADGITLADALGVVGGDPSAIASAARTSELLLGYVEVHIEQGPVLERAGAPLGVVTAIAGATRARVSFTGRAAHAGTTPMVARSDALAAAAQWVGAVESAGGDTEGLFATVGELEVLDAAPNVVPGAVRASVDVRHGDDAVREEAVAQIREAARSAGEWRGVHVAFETTLETPAVPADDALSRGLVAAVEAHGLPVVELPSGAGHDGVALSQLTGTAMLFVRCAGGISHHPDESVAAEDVAAAIDVLTSFLADV